MGTGPVRHPAAAGSFYEEDADSLLRQIEACYLDERGPGQLPVVAIDGPRRVKGLISPHAGYFFSGPVAAHGFARLAADGVPEAVVIICPSHYSWTPAIQTSGTWLTPLGHVRINSELALSIRNNLTGFAEGPSAFADEHSLEVQLPFLQHLYTDNCELVPIMVVRQDLGECQMVAHAIVAAVKETGVNAVIIASTDMTHQKPAKIAVEQDEILSDLIEQYDPDGLLSTRRDITMCGRGPVAAMMMAARELGATKAERLAYSHSGTVYAGRSVVGYLSAVIL